MLFSPADSPCQGREAAREVAQGGDGCQACQDQGRSRAQVGEGGGEEECSARGYRGVKNDDDDGDEYEDDLRMDRLVLSCQGYGQKEAAFGVKGFSGVLLLLLLYGLPALEMLARSPRVFRYKKVALHSIQETTLRLNECRLSFSVFHRMLQISPCSPSLTN